MSDVYGSTARPVIMDPWQNIVEWHGGGPCTLLVLTVSNTDESKSKAGFAQFVAPRAVGSTIGLGLSPSGDFEFATRGGRRYSPGGEDEIEQAPFEFIGPPSNPTEWGPLRAIQSGTYLRAAGALFIAVGNGVTGSVEPPWSTTPDALTSDGSVVWKCKNYRESWVCWFVGRDMSGEPTSSHPKKWIINTSTFIEVGSLMVSVALDILEPPSSGGDNILEVVGYRGQGTIRVSGNNVSYTGSNVKNFFKSGDTTRFKFTPNLVPTITLFANLRRKKDVEPLAVSGGEPLPPDA